MSFLLVRCAYDIYIKLPQNISFLVTLGDKTSYIKCTNKQGELLFSYKEKDYQWIEGSKDMFYTTIFGMDKCEKGTPLKHIASPESGVHFEGGGIKEPATYTVFEILFDINDITISQENLNYYHKLAMEMLRTFIEKYRYVTQDSTIIVPNEDDFLIIEHLIGSETSNIKGAVGIKFKPLSLKYHYDSILKKRRLKNKLPDKTLQALAARLKDGKELDLYLKFLMEAKAHAQIYNEYEISIIKSETALEIFIQNLLITICEAKETYKLAKKDYKEAIFNGNIRENLIKMYLKHFGINIAGTKEYNSWYDYCYKVRNDIVHRGNVKKLTEDDAKIAFESVYSLMQVLEKEANKVINSCVV